MVTVAMLVILRVTIGWHFLYEGVWKIKHADEFSARPFLTQAKGPAADFFYAMVPDLDGRQRLPIRTDKDGKAVVGPEVYQNAYNELKQKVVDTYHLDDEQQAKAEEAYKRYADSARRYLDDNRDAILAYFGALNRYNEEVAAGNRGAEFQKKRIWDKKQDLRNEVGVWLSDLDKIGEQYRLALSDVLSDDQKALGPVPPPVTAPDRLPVSLPVTESRSEGLDLAVTYGLTAIGLCLAVGLFSRLASLGGAAFLVSVLLTQPPWPSIYPPAPDVVGHALVVDKNFVEMIALFMLATVPAGRWGGLDFFLYYWLVRPFESKGKKTTADAVA